MPKYDVTVTLTGEIRIEAENLEAAADHARDLSVFFELFNIAPDKFDVIVVKSAEE